MVLQISTDLLSFQFISVTQLVHPNRLPGIANSKGDVFRNYVTENVGQQQPRGFLKRIYRKKYDIK